MATIRQGQHEKRGAALLYRRLGTLVLLLIVVFLARSAWDVYQKEEETAMNRAHAESQLAELTARETALKTKIDTLKTPEGMEAAMREQFQVGSPGEKMIVIVDAKDASDTSDTAPHGMMQSFWRWFTGR